MPLFLLALIQAQFSRNEEDYRLLMKTIKRDQAAFAQLYDRYSSLIYTTVVRMVKSTEEAEDLLQEIFMQIWNKASLFSESKGSVYTWIVTIARRKAIDRLRSKENVYKGASLDEESSLAVPDPAFMANPLEATISAEYESLMKKAFALLAQDQRAVLELGYYEGYTHVQIAERLNLPLGTVKTRMRQGLIKLRDFLKAGLREERG
jgi:RNA polymerase sigma-70 factor (ECF subfamily)